MPSKPEREPFDVEIRGDTVRLTTIVRYGGQVWYSTPFGVELTASCGISERTTGMGGLRAVVGFSSPIQIEEQWTLRSNVTVDRVEPVAPDDRCVLSVFQFELDATEPIMAEVRRRLEFEATRIDSVLATVELRRSLEEPWSLAQEPIRLAPDTWLSLTPLGLGYRVDPEPGPGSQQLRGHLEVAAQPQVILGRRPENPSRPLPAARSRYEWRRSVGIDRWPCRVPGAFGARVSGCHRSDLPLRGPNDGDSLRRALGIHAGPDYGGARGWGASYRLESV